MLSLFGSLIGTISDPHSGTLAGGAANLTSLLGAIIRLITIVAGIYAFINFLVGGFGFITSGGDPQAVSRSWSRIYQSLIGLAVVVLAFVFAGLMELLLDIDILDPTITGP